MLSPVARFFILMVGLILLGGCETFQLTRTGTTSETESTANSSQRTPTVTAEPVVVAEPVVAEPVAVEPPAQPAPKAKEPIPKKPVVAKEPKVAVYDSDDYAQAKAEHLQALLDKKVTALELADVGYYMDVQNAQFIQLLQPANIEIQLDGGRIMLTLPGSDSFAKNSLELKPGAELSLAITSQVLAEYSETMIMIHGHTDDFGEADYNQKLSVQRALKVANYLVDAGIKIERIAVIGFGESLPLSLNTTPEGRARNRRIELSIEPIAR